MHTGLLPGKTPKRLGYVVSISVGTADWPLKTEFSGSDTLMAVIIQ